MARASRYTLFALASLYLCYLIAANLFLNAGFLHRLVNTDPNELEVKYRHAWSWFPGNVRVTGLSVRVQDSNMQLYFELGDVGVHVSLLPLRRKEFYATHVHGDALKFRFRLKRFPKDLTKTTLAAIPPIPGYAVPVKVVTPDGPEHETWRIHLENVDVKNVAELWFEEYRFRGVARALGGFNLWTAGKELWVGDSEVRIERGELTLSDAIVANRLSGTVGATVDKLRPHDAPGNEFFRYVSGHVKGEGDIASNDFLNYYFRKSPWIRFGTANGHLTVDAHVDRGALRPHSTFRARGENIAVSLWGHAITGAGEIALAGATPHLTARLDTYKWNSHVEGKNLTLTFATRPLHLAEAIPPFTLELDLPRATITTLTFLNDYLPEGSRVHFLGGEGTLAAKIRASSNSLFEDRGTVEVETKDVRIGFRGREILGKVHVLGKINRANIDRGDFDIAGTRIAVSLPRRAWWANITLPRARFTHGKKSEVKGRLALEAKDARPILDLFLGIENSSVPGFVKDILAFDNLRLSVDTFVGPRQLSISNLRATSNGPELKGWLSEVGDFREGKLLLIYGPLAAGLNVTSDGMNLRLEDAYAWYGERPKKDETRIAE